MTLARIGRERILGSPPGREILGLLRRHGAAVLDLLWPPLCPACGARADHPRQQFCEPCWASLRRARPGRTPPDGPGPVLAAFAVDALFLDMLTTSKYRRFRSVGRRLARESAAVLAPCLPPGILVPVPLPRAKRRERGFNQTEDFARELARRTCLPVRPRWLRRRRGGRALAGRDRSARLAAVRGAFAPGRAFPGRDSGPVILVDDVYTTGSTVAECARALDAAEGGRVAAVAVMGRAFAPADDVPPCRMEALGRL